MNIHLFDYTTIAREITSVVYDFAQSGSCSFMLTGGRSAEALYRTWMTLPESPVSLPGVKYYFTDERCVPFDHKDSNYNLARNTLFADSRVHPSTQIFPMRTDDSSLTSSSESYAKILPQSVDVLLLSMGEDGHIASLFPYSKTLDESRRLVVPTSSKDHKYKRITVTQQVIKNAKHVFVFAIGCKKREMYLKAIRTPNNHSQIPACLVLDRTWIFSK